MSKKRHINISVEVPGDYAYRLPMQELLEFVAGHFGDEAILTNYTDTYTNYRDPLLSSISSGSYASTPDSRHL